jgi:hypothetical protein
MSGQIFISYRREESRWSARSLHDRLTQRFDRNQIFMDVDSVGLGEDFVKTIEETVGSCDVLIAVIGKGWLISCDQEGQRRLDNPEDFVRIEIATALKRGIRVIPVLVDGVSMPRAGDLPDELKLLVRRNALQVGDTHFDDDCRRLVAAIEQALEKTAAERREREEKERLGNEPQAQPLGPVAPSTSPVKPEADKPSAETLKAFYPLPPKPAEPEREKPPPTSSGGTGGKAPSKQVIAFLAIAMVLVVGALIYLAIRASQSPPPQPAPIAAATPSHSALTAPAQVATIPSYVTPMPYVIENQWGGSAAPWHPGGTWLIGGRNGQAVVAIDVTSSDNGATLNGTITYKGEGPIGFHGRAIGGNNYIVEDQWGGNSAPWQPGGTWVLGGRDNHPVVAINVKSPDDGATLTGTMAYRAEGPIRFKARQAQ